jgi:hypothetical protein
LLLIFPPSSLFRLTSFADFETTPWLHHQLISQNPLSCLLYRISPAHALAASVKKGLHPLQPRRADFTPITSDTQTWEKKMLKNFVKIRVGRMNVATITTSIRRHRGRYMPGKRFQEARMNPFQYKRTAKAA